MLGPFGSVTFGVASVAPAYSLAATIGLIAAAVGLASPFIMLVASVPMMMVSAGFLLREPRRPRLWAVLHLVGACDGASRGLGRRLRGRGCFP
ncbi:MAG TPA: hypothetical protein VJ787_02335, partial [Thermoleophilia bacterium]|nr:hypothetical protein [Thermoleophilia bacterium]